MITLYSKPNCQYCLMAKSFLKNNDIEYTEIDIAVDESARDFLIAEGRRTMPQIYKDGNLLVEGGYTGLVELGVDGLVKLLETNSVNVTDLGSI